MTNTTVTRTVETGAQEAAHARYGAISEAYRKLTDQAKALVEAVSDEWAAADDLLRTVQSAPGIDLPATGEPYTYEQRAELEQLAVERLARIFPWAKL